MTVELCSVQADSALHFEGVGIRWNLDMIMWHVMSSSSRKANSLPTPAVTGDICCTRYHDIESTIRNASPDAKSSNFVKFRGTF